MKFIYTLWISRWIATARERIPGSIDNDVTGVSECSQQRGNLKDNGYKYNVLILLICGIFMGYNVR
ncbi:MULTISPECIES: hypothetical protein [Photorhabdus]|uniref:Uncharacterized protein n=1 Tax=Photorhabdus bodei TaxID=2029681 RepID=A0AAW6BRA9_9GAMM|nr:MULTISPECIES: hypothetical protein [Photorhabdus]MCT8353403.1 hypothetical protein [Photorhabdus kayaii]MDB6374244.1 hypothetical protein [Photorhabdus bodei]